MSEEKKEKIYRSQKWKKNNTTVLKKNVYQKELIFKPYKTEQSLIILTILIFVFFLTKYSFEHDSSGFHFSALVKIVVPYFS